MHLATKPMNPFVLVKMFMDTVQAEVYQKRYKVIRTFV